jgi:hypothetical protein
LQHKSRAVYSSFLYNNCTLFLINNIPYLHFHVVRPWVIPILINASRIKEEQCYRDQKIDSYRQTYAYGEVLDFGRSRISVEIPANFEPVQFDSNESQTRMRWLDDSTNSYLTIVSEYGSPSLPISLVTGNLTFHIVSQLILRSTYL